MLHKDLDVWKESMRLVSEVYELTSSFPKEEQYGLTAQIRRAAVSIPSNIAEGAARQGHKEFIQFLYIALGSLMELETQLIISVNLSFIREQDKENIDTKIQEIGKMLNGLIRYRKSKLSKS